VTCDAHTHFLPADLVRGHPFYGPLWHNADARAAAHGLVDVELWTYPVATLLAGMSSERQRAAVRSLNDQVAGLAAKHPGRVRGTICIYPPLGPAAVTAEVGHATAAGLWGFSVCSSYGDAYLDDPMFKPVFGLACDLGHPVFVHPTPKVDVAASGLGDYHLAPMLGFVFDSSISVARMIMAGVLDRYPKLRLICTHLGGVLPFLAGRIDSLAAAFGERERLSAAPSQYLSRLYFDTCTGQVSALRCALELVGPGHLLLGTDFPAATDAAEAIAAIRSLGLEAAAEKAVLGGNLRRLLQH